jgi:glyoxylase-like metal-dependent hydrolase (beta-lactamase superfamily II)
VLVDAGNSPRHARRILSLLREKSLPTITHLIYTHYHWDHTFGGMVWGNAALIAHEQCRDLMRSQYASKNWNSMVIQEEIRLNPLRKNALRALDRAVDDWRNFRVVLPGVTFTKQMDVYLDSVMLELRHVGGQHSPDAITVRVKQDKVLFIGDCYYQPPTHLRKPEDTIDKPMLASLLEEPADIYIEGHDQPQTYAQLQAIL